MEVAAWINIFKSTNKIRKEIFCKVYWGIKIFIWQIWNAQNVSTNIKTWNLNEECFIKDLIAIKFFRSTLKVTNVSPYKLSFLFYLHWYYCYGTIQSTSWLKVFYKKFTSEEKKIHSFWRIKFYFSFKTLIFF